MQFLFTLQKSFLYSYELGKQQWVCAGLHVDLLQLARDILNQLLGLAGRLNVRVVEQLRRQRGRDVGVQMAAERTAKVAVD